MNYSLSSFTLRIDGVDVSSSVESLTISQQAPVENSPLLWSGRFSVCWLPQNLALPETFFNELTNPSIWRTGLSNVVLQINGHTVATLRILEYAYNTTTRIGSGSLTQTLALGDNSIKSTLLSKVKNSLMTEVIKKALQLAFANCLSSPGFAVTRPAFLTDAQIYTTSPISEACKISTSDWRWLSQRPDGALTQIDGSSAPYLLARALDEVEWSPQSDASELVFQIIATGTKYKRVALPPPAAVPPRQTVASTDTKEPQNKVFKASTSKAPTLSNRKTIYYGYTDEHISFSSSLVPYTFDTYQDLEQSINGKDLSDFGIKLPIQTVTVIQRPAGAIFSSLGLNFTLRVSEMLIETPYTRSRYLAAGLLNKSAGTDFTLKLASRELLTSDRSQSTNATTSPPPEEVQSPQFAYVATLLTATENVGTSWQLFNRKSSRTVDFGVVDSQTRLKFLAQQMSRRCIRRASGVQIQMPIAMEWLLAGCPPLFECVIHDRRLFAEGIIIDISRDQGCAMSFYGGLISSLTTPVESQDPYSAFATTNTLYFRYVVGMPIAPFGTAGILTTPLPSGLVFEADQLSGSFTMVGGYFLSTAEGTVLNYTIVAAPSEVYAEVANEIVGSSLVLTSRLTVDTVTLSSTFLQASSTMTVATVASGTALEGQQPLGTIVPIGDITIA